jgi:peptide/nickel transport system ATP-binding protein
MTAPALLDVKELSVRFLLGSHGRRGIVSAVTDISLQLSAGRILTLVGELGCSKSVLVASLLGLLPASAEVHGRAILTTGDGASIELLGAAEHLLQSRVRGRLIGLVPQSAALISLPSAESAPSSPKQSTSCETPPSRHSEPSRFRSRARRHSEPNGGVIEELIRRAGLEIDVLSRYPHELSGGMAQRVGVASALAGNLQWCSLMNSPPGWTAHWWTAPSTNSPHWPRTGTRYC